MSRFLNDPALSTNVFFPRPDARPAPPGARDLEIAVDGAVLHARVHDGGAAPRAAILLFHGNGEVVPDYDGHAALFAQAGAKLAVVDYRGYGRSTGAPSLRTLLTDAPAVVAALAPHLAPLPLVIMGRSLGSVCAAEIARLRLPSVTAIILESGFSDLMAFARRRGVTLDRVEEADLEALCPLRKFATSSLPLLVLHGAEDRLIVLEEGRAAYQASASQDKHLAVIPSRGHNDLSYHPLYWEALAAFVARIAP